MSDHHPSLSGLCAKTAVVHTITYFFMGLLAASFLNYKEAFSRPEMACWMRQFNDPLLVAGPLFQPIRGLLFALVLYPLREILFVRRNGWLVLCWLLVGIGILGTFGPAPGSLEGLIYTRLAVIGQLRGWLEVVPQAFLLSALLAYWVNRPEKKWLNWVLGAVFAVVMILPILGLLAHK